MKKKSKPNKFTWQDYVLVCKPEVGHIALPVNGVAFKALNVNPVNKTPGEVCKVNYETSFKRVSKNVSLYMVSDVVYHNCATLYFSFLGNDKLFHSFINKEKSNRQYPYDHMASQWIFLPVNNVLKGKKVVLIDTGLRNCVFDYLKQDKNTPESVTHTSARGIITWNTLQLLVELSGGTLARNVTKKTDIVVCEGKNPCVKGRDVPEHVKVMNAYIFLAYLKKHLSAA
jgi:hypothetical protein